jgi:hypothetical protein
LCPTDNGGTLRGRIWLAVGLVGIETARFFEASAAKAAE